MKCYKCTYYLLEITDMELAAKRDQGKFSDKAATAEACELFDLDMSKARKIDGAFFSRSYERLVFEAVVMGDMEEIEPKK